MHEVLRIRPDPSGIRQRHVRSVVRWCLVGDALDDATFDALLAGLDQRLLGHAVDVDRPGS
jgi:hypothetical protein